MLGATREPRRFSAPVRKHALKNARYASVAGIRATKARVKPTSAPGTAGVRLIGREAAGRCGC